MTRKHVPKSKKENQELGQVPRRPRQTASTVTRILKPRRVAMYNYESYIAGILYRAEDKNAPVFHEALEVFRHGLAEVGMTEGEFEAIDFESYSNIAKIACGSGSERMDVLSTRYVEEKNKKNSARDIPGNKEYVDKAFRKIKRLMGSLAKHSDCHSIFVMTFKKNSYMHAKGMNAGRVNRRNVHRNGGPTYTEFLVSELLAEYDTSSAIENR